MELFWSGVDAKDITVTENGKNSWRFTGFYGHPDAGQRKESWDLLRNLSKKSIRPWLCAGDFNEILTQNEKFGQLARPQWQIDAFRRCLEDCQLTDMGAEGEMFTWSNRRTTANRSSSSDRACCTTAWMVAFPRARATNLVIGGSDHCIVQISLDQMGIQGSNRRPKRFRFEAAWLREPSCEEWERREFGNVRSRIRQLEDRILSLDKGNLSTDSKQLLEMMKSELEELLAREELLWKQRSKAEWLREGDKNTAYFHARANERRKRNMISSLQSEEGCFTSDRENIQDIVLRHFKTVYSSTNPDLSVMEAILDTINPRVTGEMNEALLQPFSPEEVKRALDQMYPYKSPGPDEAFSCMIQKEEREGNIQGVAVCRNAPPVSHLLFADDTTLLPSNN
ncbi:UNVERIFIED_CONTAM: hypothetical protein Sradi_1775300 [Sesamum radiatum]|uniref:Uncharacterized protein n=1 Tax=Sesamum radiatum TaxID=300843 RepID=A0AAW2TVC3_SESRA